MEAGKNSSLLEHDRIPPGAIFMSNRTTKKECFRLKLFGLPSSHASFVRKINVGMILFLFEYEERKLYGVFEATSDGSTGIIPTAFVTSGKEFSAQVRFRTIWYCNPLPETEFRDAIKENYYAPKKFHFQLSETQVCKLLCLFDSKKTKIQQFYRGGSNLTLEFRYWGTSDSEKRKNMFRKYELTKESNAELGMYPDLPATSLHHVMRHQRYSLPAGSSGVASETALQPAVSALEESKRPDLINPTSRNTLASGKYLTTSQDHYSYRLSPYLQVRRSPVNTGMDNASVDAVDSYPTGSHLSYPFPRGHYSISQPDRGHLTSSSVHKNMGIPQEPSYKDMGIRHSPQESSYTVGVSSCGLMPPIVSRDIQNRVSTNSLQDSTSRNFLSRVGEIDLPSYQNFNDPCNPEILYSNRGGYMNVHRDVSTRAHVLARPELLTYNLTSLANDHSEGPKSLEPDPYGTIPRYQYEQSGLKVSKSWFHSSQERGLSRIQYGGDFSEHQYEGSSSHQLNEDDEYYHVAASSRLHLENHEKRTSVFSRLSGPRKSSVEKTVTFKHNLVVLVDCPERKRNSRIKMTRVSDSKEPERTPPATFKKMKVAPDFKKADGLPDQTVVLDGDEQPEHSGASDPQVISLHDGVASSSQEANETSTIRPFVNFKRRSEAQRTAADQRETSSSLQQTGTDVSQAKQKRKKLQRPSLVEEDPSGNDLEMRNLLEPPQQLSIKGKAGVASTTESRPSVGNESVRAAGGKPLDEHLMSAADDVPKVTSLSGGDGAASEGQVKGLGEEESSHQGPPLVTDGDGSGKYDASEVDASEGKRHGGDHSETPSGPQRGMAAVRGTRSSPRLTNAWCVLQERQAASQRVSTAAHSPESPEPPEKTAAV